MLYIIDSANDEEIQNALELGACGITANPTMYLKNKQNFYSFLSKYSQFELPFLSGEVMGETIEEMLLEVNKIIAIDPNIIIKLNFSSNALRLCNILKKRGIRTAITLIFTINQAVAAINAGANYLFPFIGRSDEYGLDGMKLVTTIQQIIIKNNYPVSVVAASIKNVHQLEILAESSVDYAAIPYNLYIKSLDHPLTQSNQKAFYDDWKQVNK